MKGGERKSGGSDLDKSEACSKIKIKVKSQLKRSESIRSWVWKRTRVHIQIRFRSSTLPTCGEMRWLSAVCTSQPAGWVPSPRSSLCWRALHQSASLFFPTHQREETGCNQYLLSLICIHVHIFHTLIVLFIPLSWRLNLQLCLYLVYIYPFPWHSGLRGWNKQLAVVDFQNCVF